MGKKKLDVMAKEREIFIHGQTDEEGNIIVPGCVRNGIDEKSANKIFDEMAEFAKYAFNKSHAAAYAVLSYQTAYLKTYYPAEFMAAMLNSFLGNLDKIPGYIDECKRLNVEILKPDINKSCTRFTVDGNKIRFGLGSIKNVGTSAVDEIVKEKNENGEYKDFGDFCERIKDASVNKKCIESLIKAGAFESFEQTRSTLMESFESIIDSISDSNKKNFDGQVTMFDLGGMGEEDKQEMNELKYTYKIVPEYSEKELLFMEKEMLGLYISGHPLEKIREQIELQTNINTYEMRQIAGNSIETDEEALQLLEQRDVPKNVPFKDGQSVKYAGIISSIKKKYTKNNTIMAFVTIEDLYGSAEIIVFESCFQNCSDILMVDNIVLVEGRLSIREDEQPTIIAKEIKEFGVQKKKVLSLDVTGLSDEMKEKLRGAIKFFTGEMNNMQLQIINGEKKNMAGGMYTTPDILSELKDLIGENRVKIEEI